MFTFELNLIDDHFDELEKRIKALSKSSGFVGYSQDQGIHEPSGLTYPHLVGILSVGYSPNNLPARPIFDIAGQTFKFKNKKMQKDLTSYFSNIKRNKAPISTEKINKNWCKAMGDEVLDIFGESPPLASNADSVIAKKGKNAPLEDTGDLKDNLGYQVNSSLTKQVKQLG